MNKPLTKEEIITMLPLKVKITQEMINLGKSINKDREFGPIKNLGNIEHCIGAHSY